jgi:tight adherence protein C
VSPFAALVGLLVLVGGAVGARARAAARAARHRLRLDGHDPRRRRRRRRRRASTEDADPTTTYPDVVDLLAVAAASGLPAAPAVAAVASRVPAPWSDAFAACVARAEAGELFADALGDITTRVGDVARPLVAVLRSGLVDGDRLAADLLRVAGDGRDLRRRRAEEQARRIPVRLLLPLVSCSLPAFAVLSIVPIVAGTLDGLRFPSVPD